MRYDLSIVEEQLLATLRENTTLQSVNNIKCHAGDVNRLTFTDPSMGEGYVSLLPFVLLQYRGRRASESNTYSDGILYDHELSFRFYVGAESLRRAREGQLSCYEMLAAVFDAIHGKYANVTTDPYQNKLSGPALDTPEAHCIAPVLEAGGSDEQLIVNMAHIVVYQTDYRVTMSA